MAASFAHEKTRYAELAHRYVAIAVRDGDLPALDGSIRCTDCERPASQYDHRDYLKPLEVQPVCSRCNVLRGPGANRDTSLRPVLRKIPLIRRARLESGMTQTELARLVGKDQSWVSKIEAGHAKPDLDLAPKLAHALKLDVVSVLYGPNAPTRKPRKRVA